MSVDGMRRLSACMVLCFAFASVLMVARPVCALDKPGKGRLPRKTGKENLSRRSPEELYVKYEALNTPKNLSVQFVGGKPLRFVEEQIHILFEIARRKTPEARRVLVRVFDEYLARIEKLGSAKFRTSPLQPLQMVMVRMLAPKVGFPLVRTRLETFVKCPVVKEYARAHALVVLVEVQIKTVKFDTDMDGTKRGKMLLDGLIGDMSFSDLTHAPIRTHCVARLATVIGGKKPDMVWHVLKAADTLPKRYCRDFTFVAACSALQRSDKTLSEPDRTRLREVCKRWLKEYEPLLAKQKYPSDVLGRLLRFMAKQEGNEDLAGLMPPEDAKPVRPGR